MRLSVPLLVCVVCVNLITVQSKQLNLTIIHNNDIHGRFVPTDVYGNDCEGNDVHCYGGIARTVYKAKQLRKETGNILFLNAGDSFVGTLWFTLYKWPLVAELVKLMDFDAMTFGNHEFDKGLEWLAPFVKATSRIPTLACNLDISNEPRFAGNVYPSKVFEIDGQKVAVIGYITPEVAQISNPGPTLKFHNEIESIRDEVERLKKDNVKIFIAVGHSGFDVDKEIATKVPDLDIVVGGHSNTFLYTGKQPAEEKAVDDYPVVIDHGNGRRTLVVQAYAFSKYLGFINIIFDDNGNVKQFTGQPILLDHTVPEDTEVRNLLAPKSERIKAEYDTPMGTTAVLLDGDCRRKECSLGNLVTDAMVASVLRNTSIRYKKGWAEYPVAFVSGGGIRASIDEVSKSGNVTMRDVWKVFPFDNSNDIVGLVVPGKVLKEAFEHSVFRFTPNMKAYAGEYLQMSGFRVKYDISKPVGKRVVNLEVRCGDCRVPIYEAFDESKTYKVITTSYVADGGDLYSMLKNVKQIPLLTRIQDRLGEHMKDYSPLTVGLEDRSLFVSDRRGKSLDDQTSAAANLIKQSSFNSFLFMLIIVCLRLF